jgi:hypothetical protein
MQGAWRGLQIATDFALCDAQGYVYAARKAAATLAAALGQADRAAELTRQAEELQER